MREISLIAYFSHGNLCRSVTNCFDGRREIAFAISLRPVARSGKEISMVTMLFRCMRAELIKLKRSFIWIVFLILPILSTLMGCFNYLQNIDILTDGWYALWTQATLFYSNFFFPPLIALYCAYLWRLENFNHNRNALMTSPIPISVLYSAQFLAVAVVVLLTQLYVGVLYVISGLAVGMQGLPPAEIFYWLLRGSLGGLSIAALQLFLSSFIRSFAVPIAIALLAGVGGLAVVNTDYRMFYPYSLMLAGMNSNRSEDLLAGQMPVFYLSCAVFLVLFFTLGIGYLKKADVRA